MPTNTTAATTAAGFHHWNSPIPYLFGGLALMSGLIALALAILACSYRKSSSNSSTGAQEKPVKEVDDEPRFVVIMPGDDNPKYLAKPVVTVQHEGHV